MAKYSVFPNPKDNLGFESGLEQLANFFTQIDDINKKRRTGDVNSLKREAEKIMFRLTLFDAPYVISITPSAAQYKNTIGAKFAPSDYIVVGRLCAASDPTRKDWEISEQINPRINISGTQYIFDPTVLGRVPNILLGGEIDASRIAPEAQDKTLREVIDRSIQAFYIFTLFK